MMGYSIEQNSFVSTWYKVDLDDPKYDWSEVSIEEDPDGYLAIDSYGFTFFNEALYIFGGDQRPPVINRLVKFDLSVFPFKFEVYDSDYSPTPRMYHSMQPVGPNLYLFGGLGDNGAAYNDFWAFNVMKEKWSLISPEGSVPSKRYGYASSVSADVMLVWGGYGNEGYLNDGYLYDISSGKWSALEYTGTAPAPRVGACAGLSGWLIFIYGGKTEAGLSDELWTYDITTQKYNLINSGDNEGPGPVWFATCRVSTSQSSFLWVLYGEAKDDTPTNQVYGYDADHNIWWEYNDEPSDTTYSRSRAAVCKPLQRILVAGGETYGLFPNSDIFYYSTEDFEFTMLGNITDSFFASANAYFQNYFYIHGGGTSASSLLRFSVPSNIFLRLPMWSFCTDNTTCNFACSYGSYRTSSNCEICPLGTYSDEFNMTECKKCPEGKYGPHYGATSLDMCYPCPEGEYNNQKGQGHCLDCPHTSTCRAGSKTSDYNSYYYHDSYIQPPIYSADAGEARRNNLIIEVVVGVVGLIVIIVMVLLRKVETFLFYFDIYSDKHNHFIGKPMYLKRTKLGGVFGMAFIFLAIIIIGVEIVNYVLNNVYETKSLVPLVVLEQDTPKFEAEFLITITLMNYGGACVDGPCASSKIYSDITGITGNWTTSYCKEEENGDCVISTLCIKCSVTKQGKFTITMDDTSGYTSGYVVNLTASSSIPRKYSSYKTYVLPDDNYVFIGSDPTRIYYDIIPSYYEDTEETGNHTGYHVSLEKATHQGSRFKPYELGLAYINYLIIFFDVDGNGLVTTRYYRQTWILLLTALLGSIFGILGTIGGLMKFAEKNVYVLHKRKKHKKYLEQLEKNFKIIKKLRKYPDFKTYIGEESPRSSRTANEASEKDKLNAEI
ncbi:unnamed protein product [Blepharisma stoltei]|uniref:Tyrosine-protein kinase ephrin type A/B receptor-like domain-containing protein n=1 Tax=Blepharisma stoltei TaxID=1481888 RepID=A0AAU9JHD3_9CILI|nr:unnamed protein product [Blepharisma stoltei]